jgi:hypothetical protein
MMVPVTVYEDLAWSFADQAAAGAEGWDILSTGCCGERGYHDAFELQRLDHPDGDLDESPFNDTTKTEGGAWEHVLHRAFGGSPLHAKALAFLADRSPREIRRILGILDDAKDYP